MQCLWFGDNPNLGIALLASSAYTMRRLPVLADVPTYTIPVAVSGPTEFQLLAVWAKTVPTFRYVEAVFRAVELYRDAVMSTPTVLIGDLNSNQIWDARHRPNSNHTALVRLLADLQMVSVYHDFFQEQHGAESTPTFHMHRNREKPYHLDYCFAPVAWRSRLKSVEVGSIERWSAVSDHLPLIVDFEPGPG